METMRAVIYHAKQDVRVEHIPIPSCGTDEIRVKIDACAVCGSDFKTFNSGNPRMKPPVTMGHEFSGVVETVGREVRGISVGERIVMATSVSCGQCVYCLRGWNNLCLNLKPMGFHFPGGMAEYMIVPAGAIRNGHVVKVPPGLAPEHAALAEPVSCAVNCVENCRITAQDTVVVVGAGPLGIMNLFVAREYGATKTILAQREGRRLEAARQFSCHRLVNTTKEDLVEIVKAETGGLGADCVIVAAPSAAAQEQAIDLVRKKGRVCLFASLPVGTNMLNLDSRKIHYNELNVLGTSDSTAGQVAKAIEILQQPSFPKDKLATHRLPLEDIDEAFSIMQSREGLRVVLIP
ncbi:MAG: alcohol dehydrogenase catalytic domain-containing protein [Spirochaetaceae bacterium]|nr:MAG: alcohol dehydrogenase catalytic domain-containing protein [Spirochaetaceae bacterium]